MTSLFRLIPSVDRVLKEPLAASALSDLGRERLTLTIRAQLDQIREQVRAGSLDADSLPDAASIATMVVERLQSAERHGFQVVHNMTGTLIHTNLGRSLLGEKAAAAAHAAAISATNLEYNLVEGKRGDRDDHVQGLICELTGAEAATVVNNNAAAVLLVLNTLALGKEVPVSRGELVEIGDAFRIPDIIERSGARLREVGTTNRTHLRDFANAIGPDTGCLMTVHTSNYVIEGFTASVDASALASLAREHALPLVCDLGSGTLVDLTEFGLPAEPTVRDALAGGADVVTFSGDKVLGGPQAGIIVGRADLIAQIKRNPLRRALRVDKLRIAALQETLRCYRNPDSLAQELPTFRSMLRAQSEVLAQAERLVPAIKARLPNDLDIGAEATQAQPGSGALPGQAIASAAIVIAASGGRLKTIEAALRALPVPVIGRIQDGKLQLDVRGLSDEAGLLESLDALQIPQ
ncbi:MAG: L-seryl-tRNA(Ser) seleniumtransferase [Gammaproteobacteria bacterium]